MSTFKVDGKVYDISSFGSNLGAGELKGLAEKSGLSASALLDKFKSAGGSVSSSARAVASASSTSAPSNTTTTPAAGGVPNWQEQLTAQTQAQATLFQNLYDFQQGLEATKNQGLIDSTTIQAEANKEIAKIEADSRNYGYELGLQGTQYTADKESEWRQAVANIETEGKVRLQDIINAGLTRVAEIEGQSAKDVADITGGYSLRSMQERTAADRDIGRMQLAGSMYGLIGSVFGG